MYDEIFMRQAISLAKSAVEHGNEPFGAVLVRNGEVVYTNENQIYTRKDPTFHAELGLLRQFSEETAVSDLSEYTLYSSCEPCYMCAGAMVWMKLGRLVYGASNKELEELLGNEVASECAETVFANSFWKPRVTGGICRKESVEVLSAYFADHKCILRRRAAVNGLCSHRTPSSK